MLSTSNRGSYLSIIGRHMQRIDGAKLLALLLSAEKISEFKIIVADNPIFKKICSENIRKTIAQSVKIFTGKDAIQEFVEYIATGELFAVPEKSIVELPEKLTAKQWEEMQKILVRIPLPVPVSAYFFAPLACRQSLQECNTGMFKNFLCYDGNDADIQKCLEILLQRYAQFAKKNAEEIKNITDLAAAMYANDLVAADLHFSLMAQTNLPFAAVLAGNPEINSFHVVDAVASADVYLLELRLRQCEECGEEATSIFAALVYFFKQVVAVQAEMSQQNNFSVACNKAFIPFPAQARLQKALKNFNTEKVIKFFLTAAKIESELKVNKEAHRFLAIELLHFIR